MGEVEAAVLTIIMHFSLSVDFQMPGIIEGMTLIFKLHRIRVEGGQYLIALLLDHLTGFDGKAP